MLAQAPHKPLRDNVSIMQGVDRDNETNAQNARVGVAEVSRLLNVSPRTVQNLVKRGELPAERDERGWYLMQRADVEALRDKRRSQRSYDDADRSEATRPRRRDADALVEQMRDEISYLRAQLATEKEANYENRRLLAAALDRIPAIEAPQPREAPLSADNEHFHSRMPDAESEAPAPTSEPRSFWSRLFNG